MLPNVDEPLAVEVAASIIRASFPAIRTEGLTHLGSGWDFDAYLTPDGWVFRLPRRADCAETLDKELCLHDVLARVLPDRVRVPRLELVAEPSAVFPLRFAGHRFIPGTSTEAVPPALLSTTARMIGEALGMIHGVPESLARAAGVCEMPTDDLGPEKWLRDRLAAAAKLHGMDATTDRALDWLRRQPPEPPLYARSLRLIHHDLCPEHLLVSPATGVLVGILDWSDAILGDPVRDFVPLAVCHGWDFANEALRCYPIPTDDAFRDRLESMARLLSVLWLAEAQARSGVTPNEIAKHVQWVHNAFADRVIE